jgi:uncharacterized protein (TIGR02300 family)
MPAPKALGARRRCLSCAAAFYDLGRTPILCPKCGAEFTVVEYPRRPEASRKYGAPFAVKEQPEEAAPADEESDEILDRDEDADEEPAAGDAEPEEL